MSIIKKVKTGLVVTGVMCALTSYFVAPVLAEPAKEGNNISEIMRAVMNPNQKAIVIKKYTTGEAKLLNAIIRAAWNSPFMDRQFVIEHGDTFTISNPFGLDRSPYIYDKNGNIIGPNPGYLQPIGYGEECGEPAYYTYANHQAEKPLNCGFDGRNEEE